jgi:uncharacterized protein (DUF2235 family)
MKNVTNVAKLAMVYRSGRSSYRRGVGTNWYSLAWGGIAGAGGQGRVDSMYERFTEIYNSEEKGARDIDIVGFSRGAALALQFANKIHRDGVYDAKLRTRIVPPIRFLGLFDTVASFGIPGNNQNWGYTLSVPPNVKTARHAVARDEYRGTFPLTRMENPKCGDDPRIEEKYFEGAHSDVGGGYEDNDMLARIPLQWMWNEMVKAGIAMAPLPADIGTVSGKPVEHYSHRSLKHLPSRVRVWAAERAGEQPQRMVYLPECRAATPGGSR